MERSHAEDRPAEGYDRPRDVERQHGHGPDATGGDGYERHSGHHTEMVADFRRRFWASLALTVPVIALAPRSLLCRKASPSRER